MENYEDIIRLPHHVSKKHPRLSMEQRAAQFAPFAALTGYEDAVRETARITEDRIELDEEEKIKLNNKLQELEKNIEIKPNATITYFVPDIKKSGGEYITVSGKLKRIDDYRKLLILENRTQIPINEIIEIL